MCQDVNCIAHKQKNLQGRCNIHISFMCCFKKIRSASLSKKATPVAITIERKEEGGGLFFFFFSFFKLGEKNQKFKNPGVHIY